jgi:hypothetical protein
MINHDKYISASDLVTQRLHYFDGKVYWKSNNGELGLEAGCVSSSDGYRYVSIKTNSGRARLPVHRIVFFLVNKYWPEGFMDHIDHDRLNNKIENLRVVTNNENQKNTNISTKNKSGITGVHFNKQKNKWKAEICVDRKNIYLGIFSDFLEAVKVRKEAEKKYGFHVNHGTNIPRINQ